MSRAHEETGDTPIRNYLIGCLYKGTLPYSYVRILLCIARNTYGFGMRRQEDEKPRRFDRFWCSQDDLAEELEMDKDYFKRRFREMRKAKIIRIIKKAKGRQPALLEINSDPSKWKITKPENDPKPIGKRSKNTPSTKGGHFGPNQPSKGGPKTPPLEGTENTPSTDRRGGEKHPPRIDNGPHNHAGSSRPELKNRIKEENKRGDFSSDFLFKISDRLWRQLQAFYSKDQQVKTEETFEQIHQAVTEHCGHPNFDQTWQALLTQQFAEEEADPTLASQPLRLLDRLAAELDRDRPERRKTA